MRILAHEEYLAATPLEEQTRLLDDWEFRRADKIFALTSRIMVDPQPATTNFPGGMP